jgi:hypothetical protein
MCRTTRRYIPEDSTLHSHRSENLISNKRSIVCPANNHVSTGEFRRSHSGDCKDSWSMHYVNVGSVDHASEALTAAIFRVELRSANLYVCVHFGPTDPRRGRVGAHSQCQPIETLGKEILPKMALLRAIKCIKRTPVPKRSQRQMLLNYEDFCLPGCIPSCTTLQRFRGNLLPPSSEWKWEMRIMCVCTLWSNRSTEKGVEVHSQCRPIETVEKEILPKMAFLRAIKCKNNINSQVVKTANVA